jgi:hypothetical protein
MTDTGCTLLKRPAEAIDVPRGGAVEDHVDDMVSGAA